MRNLLTLIVMSSAAASWATSDDAGAWVNVPQNLVLEAKPGTWKAQWIDAGPDITPDSFGRVFYLRKTFRTQNPSAYRRVYVSADSKYKLWVNGVPGGRGPARFDPDHQMYDTIDLSALIKPGENVIAAEVIYWGRGEPSRGGPIFQMSARPAFVLESAEVKSDNTWKALVSPVFELEATLPQGVKADVMLPDGTRHEIGPGLHTLKAKR